MTCQTEINSAQGSTKLHEFHQKHRIEREKTKTSCALFFQIGLKAISSHFLPPGKGGLLGSDVKESETPHIGCEGENFIRKRDNRTRQMQRTSGSQQNKTGQSVFGEREAGVAVNMNSLIRSAQSIFNNTET